VAIIGGNHLAYLTVQFAKLVFGLHVTLFGVEGLQGLGEFGADAVETISIGSIKKFEQKFEFIVITESLEVDIAKAVINIAIRSGQIYIASPLSYHHSIVVFDLVGGQR